MVRVMAESDHPIREGALQESDNPDHSFAPPPLPGNTDNRHARFTERFVRTGDTRQPTRHHPLRTPGSSHHPLAEPPVNPLSPAIVVVGVCSSGKSTLVQSLRERGYSARAVSQEHSYVPYLWQRSRPDLLIYLDASLHTIRGRGRPRWPSHLLAEEHLRLQHARSHSDLYIHTDGLSPHDVASRVITFIANL
jgi:hypothetical protein